MPNEAQTWHYGLVARWWAEFNVASPTELAYYRAIVERYGELALDLGCGTGRILLPLLRAGLDIDGCDVSPDMLALCRKQAAREGLDPRLYAQASHELELPRAYRTIYICDSFGIVGTGDSVRRCYQQLAPGGALVFNLSLPYKKADNWRYWLPEERSKLPEAWPETGTRRRTASGDEIELRSRLVNFDPLEQRVTTQMRATLWREGVAVADEEYTLRQHLYFRNELVALLAKAGFEDVAMYGADGEAPATADDLDVVFVGRK
jgi:SAM-dependent methyltransferase